MKVIFLDVDGVLNDQSLIAYAKSHGMLRSSYAISRDAMVAFRTMWLLAQKPSIVITSTWRLLEGHRSVLHAVLFAYGIENCIGQTCSGYAGKRGPQIQAWLDDHPEVEEFLILDDESFDIDPTPGLTSHIVKPSFWNGAFNDNHIAECLRIIGESDETPEGYGDDRGAAACTQPDMEDVVQGEAEDFFTPVGKRCAEEGNRKA